MPRDAPTVNTNLEKKNEDSEDQKIGIRKKGPANVEGFEFWKVLIEAIAESLSCWKLLFSEACICLSLSHQLDVWDGDASNDVMICDSELQSQKTKEGLTAFKEDIQHAFSSFQWFCVP